MAVSRYIKKVIDRIQLPARYVSVESQSNSITPLDYNLGSSILLNKAELALLRQVALAYPFMPQFDSNSTRSAATYYATINDVILCGSTGLLFRKSDQSFLIESGMTYVRTIKASRNQYKNVRYHRITAPVTSIYLYPWAKQNIYHWFVECLPRLALLRRIENLQFITVLTPKDLPEYQRETLAFVCAALYPIQVDVQYIDTNYDYLLSQYTFLPFVARDMFGYIAEDHGNFVSTAVIKGYGLSSDRKKRVFISRRKASRRRIRNEEELANWLIAQYSFEVHLPENYSYKEQVALFLNAEVVISSHGAGLTNLLFCSPETVVVELFSRDKVKPHYLGLSKGVGLNYNYIIGSSQDEREDYSIESSLFQQSIDQIMSSINT